MALTIANIEIIVIDEKSFCGKNFLVKVNLALKQIKGNNLPFGGLSIVVFGDEWQIPAILDVSTWSKIE